MKKWIVYTLIITAAIGFTSCYKNYYDVSNTALQTIDSSVSFRNDVVPIVISGGCGCHNNGSTKQVAFSHVDTVFYSTILARSAKLDSMATGLIEHPGEGGVYFTPSQANIVKAWYSQGAKDDGDTSSAISGNISYAKNIVPIYQTVCKGSSCHGGAGPTLDLTVLSANQSTLTTMMNSKGASGHPGGTISLSSSTATTFLAWIAQGMQP